MNTILTYFVSMFVILITVSITLYFKTELERMFSERKEVIAFHICNVVIILMTTFAANAFTTIFIIGEELKLTRQLFILLFMVLPFYIMGYVAFEHYKVMRRKYIKVENGKVLVIKEKYLNKQ